MYIWIKNVISHKTQNFFLQFLYTSKIFYTVKIDNFLKINYIHIIQLEAS